MRMVFELGERYGVLVDDVRPFSLVFAQKLFIGSQFIVGSVFFGQIDPWSEPLPVSGPELYGVLQYLG